MNKWKITQFYAEGSFILQALGWVKLGQCPLDIERLIWKLETLFWWGEQDSNEARAVEGAIEDSVDDMLMRGRRP